MPTAPPPPEQPDAPEPTRARALGYRIGFVIGRGVRIALRTVLAVLVLLILVTLALQIPAVQRWAVRKTAAQVTELLGTEFGVDAIRIVPFTQIALDGAYLLDQRRDTLLKTGSLRVNLFQPLRSLYERRLLVESIALNAPDLRLRRDGALPEGNYQFVLDKLGLGSGPPDPNAPPRQPIALDLRELTVTEASFTLVDSLGGQRLDGRLRLLDVTLDLLDLPGKRIDGQSVIARDVFVNVTRYVVGEVDVPSGPGGRDADTERIGLQGPSGPPAAPAPDTPSPAPLLPYFFAELGELDVSGVYVAVDDRRAEPKPHGAFDAKHFAIEDAGIRLEDLSLTPDSLGVRVASARFDESRSGLALRDFRAEAIELTNRSARLRDFRIETPNSSVGSGLAVRIPADTDWREAIATGRYEARLDEAYVGVADLLRLAPALQRVRGLTAFPQGRITLSADVDGTASRIRADGLRVTLPDGSKLHADLTARNIQNPKEAFLFVEVESLVTDVAKVRAWLPDVRVPEPFTRLGAIDFAGKFVGFATDFTADGDFRTGLGRATLDTRFVVRGDVPTYTGQARLYDFDLGSFIANEQVGRVTANVDIVEGEGLRRETVRLDLAGAVDALGFRGYEYHSVAINGALTPDGFEGQLSSADPNAAFAFDGRLDNRPGRERFGFTLDVENLDPNALRLWDNGWRGRGRFTVNSNSLDVENLEGTVSVDSLAIRNADGRAYAFERLTATQAIAPDGDKRLVFESPVVDLELSGAYALKTLPRALQSAFAKTYPELYARARLRPVTPLPDSVHTRISLAAKLGEVDTVLNVFGLPVSQLDGAVLGLDFDDVREDIDFTFSGVSPRIGAVTLANFGFELAGQSGDLQLNGLVNELSFGGGKFGFTNVNLFSEYSQGDLRFSVSSDTTTRVLGEIKLAGNVQLYDTAVVFSLDAGSHVDVTGERWAIDGGNELTLGNKRVVAKDLVLRSGERFVEVESVGERGVNVLVRQFDLEVFNAYLNPEKIQIGGAVDAYLSAEDIYAQTGVTASLSVDTFQMNGVDWGAIQTLVQRGDSTQAVSAYTTFTRDGQQAVIEGSIATAAGQVVAGEPRERNYFDADVTSEDFDMSFLSYFIPGITDLRGKLGADLHFAGTPAYIVPSGGILVEDVGITVDYLQTRYFVDSQFVSVNERRLDATGRQIRDRFGNTATLTGGLTHEGMKGWALDVSLRTKRLQVLNTGKRDNPLFYGSAFMEGKVSFLGPFNRTDIAIAATTLKDTRIVFPVSGATAESELRFIRFRQPEDSLRQVTATTLRGLDLDMDLTVTPVAELLLIFDETAGDIMRAQGAGDIAIDIKRSGAYTMFGNFEVDEGDYLFTLLNVVNKPFTILPGGTINWTGDPFLAELNLVARYEGLQAAPSGLIGELIRGQDNLEELAGIATPVELTMALTGDLQRPDVAFGIDLPDVQGQLRNYLNSQLALIRADPNELNRQVFGLVVIGQFLPRFTDLQATTVGFNTLSELFSSQLSYLLSGLLTSLTGENSALSGIDFDIGLQNSSSLRGAGAGAAGNDVATRLRTYFLEDRLEIGLGAAFGQNGSTNQGSLTAGNFEVVYAISDNRRLRLRAFLSRNIDIDQANLTRAGVGVTYRREFDGFGELLGVKAEERKRGRVEVERKF